jgi:hypothetical protein
MGCCKKNPDAGDPTDADGGRKNPFADEKHPRWCTDVLLLLFFILHQFVFVSVGIYGFEYGNNKLVSGLQVKPV